MSDDRPCIECPTCGKDLTYFAFDGFVNHLESVKDKMRKENKNITEYSKYELIMILIEIFKEERDRLR